MNIRINNILHFLILFLTFFILESYGGDNGIANLTVDFKRSFVEKGRRENVSGTIYYTGTSKTVVHIKEPLSQWVLLVDKRMVIFYPRSNRAFRIKNRSHSFSLPFFQNFFWALQGEWGIQNNGFELENTNKSGDSIVTVWSPPKKLKKSISKARVSFVHNRLAKVIFYDKENNPISLSAFSEYELIDGFAAPMLIKTQRSKNHMETSERLTYSNLVLNTTIPDSIVSFKLPPDAKIKEVEW